MAFSLLDGLRLRNCSLTVFLQPSSMWGVDLVPPAHVQRIQPSTELPRGQSQPPVASSRVWEDLRTQSSSFALDDGSSLHTPLIYTYDELGGASNIVGKALCTAGGYASFEVGATTIISANHNLDIVSVTAVIISGILIFTVIQAQDFPDVEGDKLARRMTFPIYAPELSRFLTLFAIVAWSVFLSWFWGIGRISTALFISFGIHVGLRYYLCRTLAADRKSYLIFNVWLMAAHVLPLHARTSVLAL